MLVHALTLNTRIMASCIPTLKRLFEHVLRRIGLLSSRVTGTASGYRKTEEITYGLSSLPRTNTSTSHRDPYSDLDGTNDTWLLSPTAPQPPHFGGTSVVTKATA